MYKNEKNYKEQEIDVAILKERLQEIRENDIKNIYVRLNNIDSKLNSVNTKISYYIGGLAVLTILIQFIIPIFFKR